ncbi:MAG TPA: ABC transporter substrate-binding protein [Candidatus Acidoferrales bacterium]|nr:ABC transporter substrate-binding protein [Candidatus Acidoferrales bacterium]
MPRPADLPRSAFFLAALLPCILACSLLLSCNRAKTFDPSSITFLIEANPSNLDPRFATDAQSQHIDGLIFSSLVEHDDQLNLRGDLAERWETPDPLTYVFHLHRDVLFHDGRRVTSADVKATFDFLLDPANRSPKRGAFRMVTSIEATDDATVVFHLNEPYSSFIWNMSRPAVGIVPAGAGPDFARHPIGSGPFRFVSQKQDDEVVLERNPGYFRSPAQIARVRFRVVPDAVVRALELRKGAADIEMSSLSPDIVPALARQPHLEVTQRPGTNFAYIGVNLEDPILARREVRQALAFATDREAIIRYLLRGQARLATGILPPNHWAYTADVPSYPCDLSRAEKLLDAAGFPRKQGGVRLHLTLKTTTDEQARLVGAALQGQWKKAGIELELRPLELATLLSDATRGNFQLTLLRWVGGNNDPAIFDLVFSSKRFPPDGANRGHYRNPRIDSLSLQILVETNLEKRKALCAEAQRILAEDLPYLPLWFTDVVSVHRRGLGPIELSPTGDYDFLATLRPAAP